jgi:hypothetical protein
MQPLERHMTQVQTRTRSADWLFKRLPGTLAASTQHIAFGPLMNIDVIIRGSAIEYIPYGHLHAWWLLLFLIKVETICVLRLLHMGCCSDDANKK